MNATNKLLLALLLAAFAASAVAQDRPSWRQETPTRPEVPDEVEKPDFGFSINRDELMGEENEISSYGRDDDEAPVDATPSESSQPEPERLVEERAAPVEAPIEPPVEEAPAAPVAVAQDDRLAVLEPVPAPAENEAMDEVKSQSGGAAQDYQLKRKNAVAPDYPRRAWLDKTEGWVDLRLTVAPDGSVEDVQIVGAEPRRVFEKAAIRAALKWSFEPPADAGIDTPKSGVFRITFKMDG